MEAVCVFRQNYSLRQAIPVAAELCDRTVIKVAASMLSGPCQLCYNRRPL